MEVSDNEYKIGLFIKFDKSGSVLIVNPEGVKTFVGTFERLKV